MSGGRTIVETVIRPAQRDDASTIARIQVATWRSTYRGLVPDDYLDNMREERSAKIWADVLSRIDEAKAPSEAADQPLFLVAEDPAHGVVGYVLGGKERDQDPVYKAELYAIYILKDFQRRGIGRRLVQAFARGMLQRGYHNLLVWVLAENRSRHFYESLGGRWLRSKTITIGGADLEEWAYVWDDLSLLAGKG